MSIVLNGDIAIHYEVEGEGDCLVLQHGFFGSIEDWYDCGYVDALKRMYRVVLIDARGHGKSGKPHHAEQYTSYLRALDIITVLDDLKITKCHYMGYSMGGWISFGLMQWHADRFHSFILNAIHPYENDMSAIQEAVMTLESWVSQINMPENVKNRMLANDKQALLAAVQEKRIDNTVLLGNITVPCLMMDGENDEIFEKVQAGSRLSDKIEMITIPDADHDGSIRSSDFIIPQILQFLGRVPMNDI